MRRFVRRSARFWRWMNFSDMWRRPPPSSASIVFSPQAHNYYMYVNPQDGLIYFVPWDVNMSFGGYGWPGRWRELARTDITRAYTDHNILVERVLAVPEYAAAYRGHVNAMTERWFNPEKLRRAARGGFDRCWKRRIGAVEKNSGRIGNPTTQPRWGSGMSLRSFGRLWRRNGRSGIRLQVNGRAVGFKPDFRNPKRTLAEWAPVTVAAVGIMDGVDADRDRRLNDGEVKERSTSYLRRQIYQPRV